METTLRSVKLVLMGDTGVGKSSIKNKFLKDKNSSVALPTLGMELGVKKLIVEDEDVNYDINLQIFDITGHEEYLSIRMNYLFGTKAAMYIYDITDQESINNLDKWVEDLLRINNCLTFPILVVGNKSDLLEYQNGIIEDMLIMAKISKLKAQHNRVSAIDHIKTSAITGMNINEAFNKITRMLVYQKPPTRIRT